MEDALGRKGIIGMAVLVGRCLVFFIGLHVVFAETDVKVCLIGLY